ncbi:MAG: hypothetical protein K6U03_05165 [Firmicutes bacterium]|nr:hypothetical protein [Bacillota bacterium]
MKNLLTLFIVIVGILCLPSMSLAEGFTVSADYNSMTKSAGGQGFSALAFSGEDDAGPFFISGSYLFALSYDPPLPSGVKQSEDFVYLYGGYKLLDEEDADLMVLAGYYLWKENQDGVDWDLDGDADTVQNLLSSIVIGTKAGVELEPILVSALVLYGVSNEVKGYFNGLKTDSTKDVSLLYFELKGTYRFADALAAFVLYRATNYSIKGVESSINDFGLGVEYRF